MGACDGSALLQWHEIRRQTRLRRTAGFRRRGSRIGSQLELHPIIGDFPPGFTHSAILRALFIQHRVGIVNVDDNPLSLSETKRPLQQAMLAPERKMSHIACRSAAALGLDELIIFPERAIEQSEVAFVHGPLPILSKAGYARIVEKSLFFVEELEADDRFFRRKASF